MSPISAEIPLGGRTAYRLPRDRFGRVTAEIRRGGSVSLPDGQILVSQDAISQFDWDENGQLRRRTDGEGSVTQFSNNAAGMPLTVTDGLGRVWRYQWDAAQHLLSQTDPLDHSQFLRYEARQRIRQEEARPIADALLAWLRLQRQKVPSGSTIARAIDYSLNRWGPLTRYLEDPQLPIDNNWAENRIRPIAQGRSNWLFAGSLRAGQRAAAAMSLIQSARLNGHDPYAYLKDVLTRLPTQPASRVGELLPHRWQPASAPN